MYSNDFDKLSQWWLSLSKSLLSLPYAGIIQFKFNGLSQLLFMLNK